MPAGETMLALFAAGLCSGCGHLLILGGLNRAPANRVGATQYTQILWAVILGAVFFSEFPDAMTYLGLGVVGLSGILAFLGTQPASSPQPKPAE
jgi:drug/metabolite transporter (DMT)-like permease